MIPYFVAAFVICTFGSYLTYSDYRFWSGAKYLMDIAGAAMGLAWGRMVSRVNDHERVYVLSLYWDVVVAVCYYLLPLAFFAVRPTYSVLAGAAIIIVGLAVIKVYG